LTRIQPPARFTDGNTDMNNYPPSPTSDAYCVVGVSKGRGANSATERDSGRYETIDALQRLGLGSSRA